MNIAFLFNSDNPSLGGYYGRSVMNLILDSKVLQATNRNMRVSIGDILSYMSSLSKVAQIYGSYQYFCNAIYKPIEFDRLDGVALAGSYSNATVYCWLFQNMTREIAERLNQGLVGSASYLGAMDVDFSNPLHLNFFRNKLLETYRLNGINCTIFYEMGENEDPDIDVQEGFMANGFIVDYEDRGARRTFFDEYDTLEHFERVEAFKSTFARLPGLDADGASDLALSLEELHPKLFDGFAAAARVLDRAETEEELAQAALSGRRILEKSADYLFPPQSGLYNGHKVGHAEYKNRLWAYIETTLLKVGKYNQNELDRLGDEADRLVELFNGGLHADPTRERVEFAFRDLIIWLSELISIDPKSMRKPYLAYEKELLGIFN